MTGINLKGPVKSIFGDRFHLEGENQSIRKERRKATDEGLFSHELCEVTVWSGRGGGGGSRLHAFCEQKEV